MVIVQRRFGSALIAAATAFVLATALPEWLSAQALAPIVYTVRVPASDTHYVEVEMTVPTGGRAAVDLMMPVWSPGYYRMENYADRVDNVAARTPDGKTLTAEKPQKNRWRIPTDGRPSVVVSYRVFCNQRSVTTNNVTAEMGVLNGAPTFMTLVENAKRPHEVRLELPASWKRAMTGLDDAPDRKPNHFRAADYETLVDSPIMAGDLRVGEFAVDGKKHFVVGAGDIAQWDEPATTRELETYVQEVHRFWGFLPYKKYVFLLMFRQGGGGLEHKNSTLSTVSAARPMLGLLSHEYFHLFNVKNLRPVELGPFDYENPPTTGSLWIAEGVTSYYSSLLTARAGLRGRDQFLAAKGAQIGQLQNAPGRLLQSLEQSSRDVWNNSNSGVAPAATTVSYYNKGEILGFLLDARIRRATSGRKSFDDVMRLAYTRYAGPRGYTPDDFRAVAEEIGAVDLKEWFQKSVSSTEELDYTDALDWFGLRFVTPDGPTGKWSLEVRPDATAAQQEHLRDWLRPSSRHTP
jgi:predicted metalloprotease with PDZ domain